MNQPAVSQDPVKAAECYGDSIDIALCAWTDAAPAVLRIPTVMYPELNPPRDVEHSYEWIELWQRQCHEEPVLVDHLFFYFANNPFPLWGLENGLVINRIRIDGSVACEAVVDKESLEFLRGYCDPATRRGRSGIKENLGGSQKRKMDTYTPVQAMAPVFIYGLRDTSFPTVTNSRSAAPPMLAMGWNVA